MHSARTLTWLAAGVALLLLGAVAALWRTDSARAPAPAAVAQAKQAPPDGARSPPPDLARRNGSTHGRVLDHLGLGLPSLTVELHRGRELQQTQTDAQGGFSFSDLQRGLYRLSLDPASLPAGLRVLPPWKQEPASRDDEQPIGQAGTAFRLGDDSDVEVDLHVFLAGTLSGRVIEAGGKPIVNAAVGILSAEGIHDTTRTDARGRFVFDQAYPGAGVTSVDLSPAMAVEASVPLPVHFELAPGGAVELGDLVAGVGGHILRGAVTDLAGLPVAGLGILCQEEADALYKLRWQTVTDGQGRYELGRLPSSQLVLSVGADDRDRPPESRLLAENVAPIRIDTRDAAEAVELSVVSVAARHPFQVQGRVRIDIHWGWAQRIDPSWTPRVEVRESGEASAQPLAVGLPAESGSPDGGSGVTERSFTWTCATPHAELAFRAVLRMQDGTELERLATVTPSADGTQELLLSFP